MYLDVPAESIRQLIARVRSGAWGWPLEARRTISGEVTSHRYNRVIQVRKDVHVCRGWQLPAEKSQHHLSGVDQTSDTSNQKVPINENGHLRNSYPARDCQC